MRASSAGTRPEILKAPTVSAGEPQSEITKSKLLPILWPCQCYLFHNPPPRPGLPFQDHDKIGCFDL